MTRQLNPGPEMTRALKTFQEGLDKKDVRETSFESSLVGDVQSSPLKSGVFKKRKTFQHRTGKGHT